MTAKEGRLTEDNKKTGESAVDAVQHAFRSVRNVLCHLNKDDTGVCIDGYIEVYRDDALNKESLIGEIPVQVKGTHRKLKRNGRTTHSVRTLDLRKFNEVFGGTLYFVVFEDADYNVKGIFYKAYLAYDIEKSLDGKEGQGKLTEVFTPLPDETQDLQRILMEFVTDLHKQRGAGIRVFKDEDGLHESGLAIDHYEFSKTVIGNEDVLSLKMMSNATYLYGVTKEGMRCVFDKIEAPIALQRMTTCTIGSGDYTAEFSASWGEDADGEFFEFGSFLLRFGKPGNVKYQERGTFRERLRDARLFLALAENCELFVNGERLASTNCSFNGDPEALRKRLDGLERCVGLFDKLGVRRDWDPNELSESDWHAIDMLGTAFMDGNHLQLGSHDEKVINYNADIGGVRIKALASRQDDGKYKLYDPLSTEIVYAPDLGGTVEPSIENRLPAMLIFGADDFRRCANINAKRFAACFGRCSITEVNEEPATKSLLSVLLAYDRGAACKGDLLDCCVILVEALYAFDSSSEINQVNRAQVLARRGKTDSATKHQLFVLAARSESDTVKISANILLGQNDMAAVLIEGLGEHDRELFCTWPIYNLLGTTEGLGELSEPETPLELEAKD